MTTVLRNSCAFFEILNYLPQGKRVTLQALNKRFYYRLLPQSIFTLKGKWETVEAEEAFQLIWDGIGIHAAFQWPLSLLLFRT